MKGLHLLSFDNGGLIGAAVRVASVRVAPVHTYPHCSLLGGTYCEDYLVYVLRGRLAAESLNSEAVSTACMPK